MNPIRTTEELTDLLARFDWSEAFVHRCQYTATHQLVEHEGVWVEDLVPGDNCTLVLCAPPQGPPSEDSLVGVRFQFREASAILIGSGIELEPTGDVHVNHVSLTLDRESRHFIVGRSMSYDLIKWSEWRNSHSSTNEQI
jgi:hypothetical protein